MLMPCILLSIIQDFTPLFGILFIITPRGASWNSFFFLNTRLIEIVRSLWKQPESFIEGFFFCVYPFKASASDRRGVA